MNKEIADNSRACCNCANATMSYPNCYCWQHKYCNGDRPYEIPKDLWEETAKECKDFELGTPEEADVYLELHRIISEEIDNAAEKYTDNPDNYAGWTEHFGDFATKDDIDLIKRAFKAGVVWATGYNNNQEQPMPSCKSCGFYENNCPFIRGKFIPYPNKVCKDYTYSVMQEQPEVDFEESFATYLNKKDEETTFWCDEDLREMAEHFYKLGLNARKEE